MESVREPGGNITGVRFPGPEATFKRFEFLLEFVPQAKKIYIAWDTDYPGISHTIDGIRKAASVANVTLIEAPVTKLEKIKADLDARAASKNIGMDAILLIPTLLTVSPEGFSVISKFAKEHDLPIGGTVPHTADSGAIFSYAPVAYDVGKLAAPLASKILKGKPAGKIPVVSAELNLRINLKRVQELGLKVPEDLASMATEIIR